MHLVIVAARTQKEVFKASLDRETFYMRGNAKGVGVLLDECWVILFFREAKTECQKEATEIRIPQLMIFAGVAQLVERGPSPVWCVGVTLHTVD